MEYLQYLYLKNQQLENINEISINKAPNANKTIKVDVTGGVIKISLDDSTKTCGIIGFTGKPSSIILKPSYTNDSTNTSYTLTSIGNSAFQNCSSLTKINIPATVTSIEFNSFLGCTSLTNIDVESTNSNYKCSSTSKIDLLSKDGTILIQYAVGNKNISYTIPATVTTISSNAFAYCKKLSTITTEENSQLKTIGDTVFIGCYNLTTINIPATVTSIGSGSFSGCINLTNIDVDPANSNYKCSSPSKLDLLSKDGTILIQYAVGNKNISYTIPATVTTISKGAFYGCTKLSTITIESKSQLTTIGSEVFVNCLNLTKIDIPATVTSIGFYSFSGCKKLSSVTIYTKNINSSLSNVFPPTLSTLNLIGDYNNKLKNMFIKSTNSKDKPITIYYNKANVKSFKSLDKNGFSNVKYILKESPTVMKDVDLDLVDLVDVVDVVDVVDENKLNTQSYLKTKLLLAKIAH